MINAYKKSSQRIALCSKIKNNKKLNVPAKKPFSIVFTVGEIDVTLAVRLLSIPQKIHAKITRIPP